MTNGYVVFDENDKRFITAKLFHVSYFVLGHFAFHAVQHQPRDEIIPKKRAGQRRDVQDTSNNRVQPLPPQAPWQVPGSDAGSTIDHATRYNPHGQKGTEL